MIDSVTRITLNLQETNTMVSIKAKRGDTGRKLLIHLSDGSIPYHISDDCYATFTAKKPDGTKINNPCSIENNVIIYEFTEQTCTAVGTMKAEIRLYGADDKMITSACFLVNVYDTVFRDGDEVGSETEMNTLDDLILRGNEFLNETGKILRWEGSWDSEAEYEANDLVLHEEVLYVAEAAIAAGTVPGSEESAWVPIAGMIDLTGYATENWVKEQKYLESSALSSAVNDALAQAKKSGEFNGEDGYTPIKGVDYFDGEPGYTPQKGIDYFDGKDGQDGKDYVLTDDDRAEIAEQAAAMVEVPDSSAFYVTITGKAGNYTADKTFAETKEAYEVGRPVYAVVNATIDNFHTNDSIWPIINVFEGSIFFHRVESGRELLATFSNRSVTLTQYELAKKADIPTDDEIIALINEHAPDSGGNIDQVSIEPAKMDRPKVFFGAPLQQTKDEIVTTFSYRSETLSFDCYAEIKAQGNSTLNWPKKNQTVKLYKDATCTEKFKVDFKGWGKQNKFVIKANWRDLTHVRDIVSVRLEGDCMRSNPDYEELPELLKTSPNLGGIDGFPVVVYAAGVYQGRYMWNIPKDKWMTNMDDELDEHCILCSEDYNSSCFRAAANINGVDWTDEIHDTVPTSIKTRWNEVISFVMNSTDEEFAANLDSHIKVSTLIDRHIMGLYSCDYDGYGKNQLYITYDGQQWYAGRYDKDGTWGNYWTGNSMLPSNYGRDQYEDMISGRPGNLLFIRLEQLFYQRLQERWEYLKVNELSIPNTIHRVRELYDITPPYVIEEDYASTTANGAFTEIPNKATCTIQQIEKFVVERHAWMDEYMASLTPEVEVPCTGISLDKNTLTFTAEGKQTVTATIIPDGCTDSVVWVSSNPSVATISVDGNVCTVTAVANGDSTITVTCGEHSASCSVAVSGIEGDEDATYLRQNYSPNGEKFTDETAIDFNAGDYIEAEIDVANCLSSFATIFSVGADITKWALNGLHICYRNDTKVLQINFVNGAAPISYVRKEINLSENYFSIKLDKDGITIDGDRIDVSEYVVDPGTADPILVYTSVMENLKSLSAVQIGSQEGSVRSHATYNYIKVASYD